MREKQCQRSGGDTESGEYGEIRGFEGKGKRGLRAELCFSKMRMLESQLPVPRNVLYLEIGSLKE